MSLNAQRYGDRGSKKNRNSNNRKAKVEGTTDSLPKNKWEEDRKAKIKVIHPRSDAQKASLWSFEENMVTVNSGAVASGKTAVACWWAANQVAQGNFDKIVVGRPTTRLNGRDNGHRQGSLLQKLYGFHAPMIEYISDIFGRNAVDMQLEKGTGWVEILDFEAMRGITVRNRTILILDEAQLLFPDEVDCLMTRLGEGCKMILCGDPSTMQNDNKIEMNGLQYLEEIVSRYHIPNIGFVKYRIKDICRSDFVYDYVLAMQDYHNLDVS